MEKEKKAIMEITARFLSSYANKDVDGCIGLITDKVPLLMLGTNDDEIFRNKEELYTAFNRDFSMMNSIAFGEYRNLFIETDGQLASVILEVPIIYESGGKTSQALFRYALTLEAAGDEWKICAGMASVPMQSGTYSL